MPTGVLNMSLFPTEVALNFNPLISKLFITLWVSDNITWQLLLTYHSPSIICIFCLCFTSLRITLFCMARLYYTAEPYVLNHTVHSNCGKHWTIIYKNRSVTENKIFVMIYIFYTIGFCNSLQHPIEVHCFILQIIINSGKDTANGNCVCNLLSRSTDLFTICHNLIYGSLIFDISSSNSYVDLGRMVCFLHVKCATYVSEFSIRLFY